MDIGAVERVGVVTFRITGTIAGGIVCFERGLISSGNLEVKVVATPRKSETPFAIHEYISIQYGERDQLLRAAHFYGDFVGVVKITGTRNPQGSSL